MKVVTAATGGKTLKLSKAEWLAIGKNAGWKVSTHEEMVREANLMQWWIALRKKLASLSERFFGKSPEAQQKMLNLFNEAKSGRKTMDELKEEIGSLASEYLLQEQQVAALRSELEQLKAPLRVDMSLLNKIKEYKASADYVKWLKGFIDVIYNDCISDDSDKRTSGFRELRDLTGEGPSGVIGRIERNLELGFDNELARKAFAETLMTSLTHLESLLSQQEDGFSKAAAQQLVRNIDEFLSNKYQVINHARESAQDEYSAKMEERM